MAPSCGYAKVATAWIKWWLKGDQEAAKIFTGPEPGVGKMEKMDLFEEEYRIKREKPGSMPGFIR